MTDLDGSTHWEGCWRVHHDCAVAEVERATPLRDALSAACAAIRDGGDILHADRIRKVEGILFAALGVELDREASS